LMPLILHEKLSYRQLCIKPRTYAVAGYESIGPRRCSILSAFEL